MVKSWFKAAKKSGGPSADIAIYNDIGGYGVTAQDFHDALSGLGDVETIKLNISSDGGDVFAGWSIYNMLAAHPAHKVVTVMGLAASMASVIAMVGDEVVMPENAMLMIHNPWGGVVGESDQIISFGEALADMRTGLVGAYQKRTGLSEAKIIAMMDRESWLTATRSVELGFADRTVEPVQMAASAFKTGRFINVPASFGRKLKEFSMAKKPKNAAADDEFEGDDTVTQTPEEMRAAIIASNKEIRSLCALAGKPDLADSFIDEDKSVSEVLAALEELRVKEAAKSKKKPGGEDVSARHGNGGGNGEVASLDPVKIWSKFNAAGKRAA